jgi:hypothetical protein
VYICDVNKYCNGLSFNFSYNFSYNSTLKTYISHFRNIRISQLICFCNFCGEKLLRISSYLMPLHVNAVQLCCMSWVALLTVIQQSKNMANETGIYFLHIPWHLLCYLRMCVIRNAYRNCLDNDTWKMENMGGYH